MVKFAAVVEYDGTGFCGFQSQPGEVRTVQGEIIKAFHKRLKSFDEFSYAGRTDTGVHARHQVISFTTDEKLDLYRFKWQINCLLPDDIAIKRIEQTDDSFDARKSARLRQYSYLVVNNSYQSVFLKKYSLMVTKKLELPSMRKASERFIGIKDFAAFRNNEKDTDHTFRQVYSFNIRRFSGELIVFKIAANAFLYNMVRIIVGTLLEIGKGQRSIESIEEAFNTGDRSYAGKLVPAKGLFLTRVDY